MKIVWLESGWLKCVVSRRRHKEGRIEHKNSASISDHRGEIALAKQERRLEEANLERRTSYQSYKD